jgi:hypothetical protein
MGLHRRDALVKHFPDEGARKQALRIFWSVFTLDRRSSLGLGVPFVIQDTLVDPTLGALDFDHPYLRSMIPFAKLSGKAWQMSNDFSNSKKEPADADVDLVREQIDYLDYQVLQWQKQIPAPIRYCHGVTEIASCGYDSRGDYHHDIGRHGGNGRSSGIDSDSAATTSRRHFYLAVVLFVRSNQLRNLIYRPLLQSAARIRTHPEHTLTALTIARDSLQAFADLDSRTDLLHTHATFFKHFIVSSLGNLLLIVVHAAAAATTAATTEAETDTASATDTDTDLWAPIRETFHVAAALLRKLSARSGPVLRAWDRLKCLEDLQAKILAARRVKAGSMNTHVQVQGHHQHHHQRDLNLDHLEMDPYTAVSGIRPPLCAAEGGSLTGLASDNTNGNGNGNSNDNAGLPPASLLSSSSLRTEDYMLFDSQIRDEFAGLFDPTFGFGDAYEFPLP